MCTKGNGSKSYRSGRVYMRAQLQFWFNVRVRVRVGVRVGVRVRVGGRVRGRVGGRARVGVGGWGLA